MTCTGQRIRTPKEYEEARLMINSWRYHADQWACEEELQKIHETECPHHKDEHIAKGKD